MFGETVILGRNYTAIEAASFSTGLHTSKLPNGRYNVFAMMENEHELHPKPCSSCGQTMYAEARNIHVFGGKIRCCYHCGVTRGKEHSHYCSTANGLRDRGEKQIYMPGEGFIPLDRATLPFLVPR